MLATVQLSSETTAHSPTCWETQCRLCDVCQALPAYSAAISNVLYLRPRRHW